MSFRVKQFNFKSANGYITTFELDREQKQFSIIGEDDDGVEVYLAVFEEEDIQSLLDLLDLIDKQLKTE